MKTCIIGASGYSGRELVRLLLRHPFVKLTTITSRTLAGLPVDHAIANLRGQVSALNFTNPSLEELSRSDCELFFLALFVFYPQSVPRCLTATKHQNYTFYSR